MTVGLLTAWEWATDHAGDAIADAAMVPIRALAEAIGTAVEAVLVPLSTAWVRIGTPNLSDEQGADTIVGFLRAETAMYVAVLLLVSILIGALRLAWTRRGDTAQDLLQGLLVLVAISGAGATGVGLLVMAGDDFSDMIIRHATEGSGFGQNVAAMLALTGTRAPFLAIVLGLVAVIVVLVQIVLVVGRAGMLVLLVGCWPLAAAGAGTEAGKAQLRKYSAWVLAFVLYKPAAAIIYATAFRLTGTGVFEDDGVLSIIVGLALMVMAIVALPALLRFLVPAVGAMAGGGGFGRAAVAGAMVVASGARVIPPLRGGGASAAGASGGSGGSGPSGAAGPGSTGGRGGPGGAGPSGGPGHGGGSSSNGPGPAPAGASSDSSSPAPSPSGSSRPASGGPPISDGAWDRHGRDRRAAPPNGATRNRHSPTTEPGGHE